MTLGDDPLVAARLAKVDALRAAGIEPYPVGFVPDVTAAELAADHEGLGPGEGTGRSVAVAGRLVRMRDIGKLVFGVVRDGTGTIQLFGDAAGLGDRLDAFRELDLGDWVGAVGEVITTRRGELSVHVADFTMLAKALRPLPEKWHGLQDLETRYRRRYLDLAVNAEAREIAERRTATVASLRETMIRRGFVEVETPMLQSQAGGALARPFVTHHEALGIEMYLRIAPELYLKRLVVGGLPRVFEINRNFRNEGLSTTHNPEFTMLESYEAYADYHAVMELTEELVAAAAVAVHGTAEIEYQGRPLDLTPPYPRLGLLDSVGEAIGRPVSLDMPHSELASLAAAAGVELDGAWGPGKIVTEIFEKRVEPELWGPAFVVDYPEEVSPLARSHRSRPGLTERFELFAGGLEVANGYSELNDPVEQRRRFEAQARARAEGDEEAMTIDEDYLLALEHGLPPTGGLGVGVDRLVMLHCDVTSIREVILFPHLRPAPPA